MDIELLIRVDALYLLLYSYLLFLYYLIVNYYIIIYVDYILYLYKIFLVGLVLETVLF